MSSGQTRIASPEPEGQCDEKQDRLLTFSMSGALALVACGRGGPGADDDFFAVEFQRQRRKVGLIDPIRQSLQKSRGYQRFTPT